MDIYDLIVSRRTVRHFKPEPVSEELLKKMVNAGRLAPSGGNLQPIRYLVVTDKDLCAQVFETLKWAAYLRPEHDPAPGQEPAAYIIMLIDEDTANKGIQNYDVGLSAENLLLTGLAEGVAGCLLLAFDRGAVTKIFNLPEPLKPNLVVALGYPDESPIQVDSAESPKYWKDEGGVLNVPKIPLDDVMFINRVEEA